MTVRSDLLQKYDIPAPRYTSYPTVPYWSDSPTPVQWVESLNEGLEPEDSSWSMYLHIPFCESLCTFCGCNTSITKDHRREQPYVDLIHREWRAYMEKSPKLLERPLRHVHLGGGTPTFLSAESLVELMGPILESCLKEDGFEGSIEVDPRRTQADQLEALRELGFQRVSLGVQDFDLEVQRLVNRIQPFEITRDLTFKAREIGYESVNYDLIYGLPRQNLDSFRKTVELTIELAPERIALYSFALVPWIKPAQRLFKDEDLPRGEQKRNLYEMARSLFLEAGYEEIGMDHFAKPQDSLAKAQHQGQLHRNFMGYTDQRTDVMLGLGVSAISESPSCFHQNQKLLPKYQNEVEQGGIPTLRGHLLSSQDIEQREQILEFMTKGQVRLRDQDQVADIRNFLAALIEDGLVELDGRDLKMTSMGQPFLRNACMALDLRLRKTKPEAKVFSSTL